MPRKKPADHKRAITREPRLHMREYMTCSNGHQDAYLRARKVNGVWHLEGECNSCDITQTVTANDVAVSY